MAFLTVGLGIMVSATIVADRIDVMPTDDLWAILEAAQPGDEIVIHAGTYQMDGLRNFVFEGTEVDPIIIRSEEGDDVMIEGIEEQNTLNVEGSHYTIRGLRIHGGSHGIRIGNSTRAAFEDLEIWETDDVGLSANREGHVYNTLSIRRVHIHDTGGTGECMYLGCNDDGCQLFDSLIEFNWCHDTVGTEQGDGIEVKTGSYGNVIRHNVIHDTNFPGITIYGTVDNKPRNIVEGNIIWNAGDNGIQTVGDALVSNNVVFSTTLSGIAAKPSQGEQVENLRIVYNTVIGAGDACLRANQLPDGAGDVVVANNALYCGETTAIQLPDGAGDATFLANAVAGAVNGLAGGFFDGGPVADAVEDVATRNGYPTDRSPLKDSADGAETVVQDFNCLDRLQGGPDVGAYEWRQSGNPGWVVAPGFKSCAEPDGDTSGDSGDGDGDTDTDGGSTDGGDGDGDGSGTEGRDTALDPTTGGGGPSSGGGSGEGGTDSDSGGATGGGSSGGCACAAPGRSPGEGGAVAIVVIAALGGLRRRIRPARD